MKSVKGGDCKVNQAQISVNVRFLTKRRAEISALKSVERESILKILFIAGCLSLGANESFAGETFCEISGDQALGYYCSDTVEVVVGADATITQLDEDGRVVKRDSGMISFSLSNGCKIVAEEDLDDDAKFCRFHIVID